MLPLPEITSFCVNGIDGTLSDQELSQILAADPWFDDKGDKTRDLYVIYDKSGNFTASRKPFDGGEKFSVTNQRTDNERQTKLSMFFSAISFMTVLNVASTVFSAIKSFELRGSDFQWMSAFLAHICWQKGNMWFNDDIVTQTCLGKINSSTEKHTKYVESLSDELKEENKKYWQKYFDAYCEFVKIIKSSDDKKTDILANEGFGNFSEEKLATVQGNIKADETFGSILAKRFY